MVPLFYADTLNNRFALAIHNDSVAELKRHGIETPTDATVATVHKLYLAMLNERFAKRDAAFLKAHP